jgi:hypothetical protein
VYEGKVIVTIQFLSVLGTCHDVSKCCGPRHQQQTNSKSTETEASTWDYQCSERYCLGNNAASAKTFHSFCLGIVKIQFQFELNSTC